MSFTSKKIDEITTVEKKRNESEEKVLRVIVNNQNVDLEMLMTESKLSIRTVRHHLYRLIRKREIKKRNCLSDMRRVFYEVRDK